MALTQISTDGIKNGTITGSDLATNVDLVDNQKLRLGTGNDLQIYHDGTNSILTNSTGNLQIKSTSEVLLQSDAGETMVRGVPNNTVELRYNNFKKLETTSTGANVTSANDAVLKVTTTGTASTDDARIELITQESSFIIQNDRSLGTDGALTIGDGTDTYLQATKDAEIGLYFNNSKKFETTSSGVTISGTTIANGHIRVRDHTGTEDGQIMLGTGNDLRIFHDGTTSRIHSTAHPISIRSGGQFGVFKGDGSEAMLTAQQDGAVELYYDNSKKFETTSDGVTIEGSQHRFKGDIRFDNNTNAEKDIFFDESENRLNFFDDVKATFGNSNDLQIYHDGSHSYITNATNDLRILANEVIFNNASNTENKAKFINNGAVELYHDNTKRIFTESAGGAISGKSRFLGHSQGSGANSTEVHFNSDNSHIGIHFSGHGNTGNTYTAARMVINGTGGTYGTITYSLGGTGYNSQSSDSRSKKNIVEWTESELDKFKNLQPKLFHFDHNEDSDPKYKGYIAQDNLAAFPEAYPLVDDRYMFNPSGMVHYLMKAMQELVSKVEVLETEVAALKAA